jgi:hypothetical protein
MDGQQGGVKAFCTDMEIEEGEESCDKWIVHLILAWKDECVASTLSASSFHEIFASTLRPAPLGAQDR